VDGLQLLESDDPTLVLLQMVQFARQYFVDLHTPEPNPPERVASKDILLAEISAAYGPKPPPSDVPSGPFSLKEVWLLKKKMPATAPSLNGIQYTFWKHLASKVDNTDLPSFWSTFRNLTDDLIIHGTSCCHFKDANVSLFSKKGDPTLTKNYQPISSINTDCKMYTNLVNAWLTPWAVSKIHTDQKGFIPGRYITEHTHLASIVAHLSDVCYILRFAMCSSSKYIRLICLEWANSLYLLIQIFIQYGTKLDICGYSQYSLKG